MKKLLILMLFVFIFCGGSDDTNNSINPPNTDVIEEESSETEETTQTTEKIIESDNENNQVEQEKDPNFDFDVKLNNYNFRDGDNLEINIDLNQEMYLTVFQILPYEEKNYQVYKLFPLNEEANFIQSESFKLPKSNKYEIYFPENVRKKSIDEYLFFIGSKKNINWLNKYSKFEDLKKQFINSKSLVKWKYKEYTIIK